MDKKNLEGILNLLKSEARNIVLFELYESHWYENRYKTVANGKWIKNINGKIYILNLN